MLNELLFVYIFNIILTKIQNFINILVSINSKYCIYLKLYYLLIYFYTFTYNIFVYLNCYYYIWLFYYYL